MTTEWETARIPRQLYKEITDLIKQRKTYINEQEFVRSAVREKLERIKKQEC